MELIDKAMKLVIQVEGLDKDWLEFGNGSKYQWGFVETDALASIKKSIEKRGAYDFAKAYGLLVDDSAEDFMIQFMTRYNDYSCGAATY